MYTIVLVLAGVSQSVGLYDSITQCEETAKGFIKQNVPAVCVKQASPEVQVNQFMKIFQSLMKNMEN